MNSIKFYLIFVLGSGILAYILIKLPTKICVTELWRILFRTGAEGVRLFRNKKTISQAKGQSFNLKCFVRTNYLARIFLLVKMKGSKTNGTILS